MRGTLARWRRTRRSRRFIPACAGNTPRRDRPSRPAAVHPRVCGEHVSSLFQFDYIGGSSPRVRGTRSACFVSCACSTVHPRVCGEHSRCPEMAETVTGSSPRVRGTQQHDFDDVARCRFIPACAGNTTSACPRWLPSPVHPRVCGEHGEADVLPLQLDRFIPACAGNTIPSTRSLATTTVHPRVCGEHLTGDGTIESGDGSSPRVRGTRCHVGDDHRPCRFIPACAGNTFHVHHGRNRPRFIPACAGNTGH